MQVVKPREISGKILTVVDEAEQELTMVTPYVGIERWTKVREALRRAVDRDVSLHFYVRSDERTDPRPAISMVEEFAPKISLVYRLHAKLYMSEKAAVFTSMNLLQGSDDKSTDLGLYTEDPRLLSEFRHFIGSYLDPGAKPAGAVDMEPAESDLGLPSDKTPHSRLRRKLHEVAPDVRWNDGKAYWFSSNALAYGDVMISEDLTWKLYKPVKDLEEVVNRVRGLVGGEDSTRAMIEIENDDDRRHLYIRIQPEGGGDSVEFVARLFGALRREFAR